MLVASGDRAPLEHSLVNLWQTRDLTLFGKSVLAKTLGASQLIYTASLMTVPDAVIRAAQSLLFSFLWKNKKDKI